VVSNHQQRRNLPDAAIATLAAFIDRLAIIRDPWWLIGGAAVALQGVPIDPLADIDVIMSKQDAGKVLSDLGIAPERPGGSELFRSAVFGRWLALPIPVDIMGDFEVRTPEGWVRVAPRTREPVIIDGRIAYVPARQELIAILRRFGRPKDLERARRLGRAGQ
jgi:hypothetical protein